MYHIPEFLLFPQCSFNAMKRNASQPQCYIFSTEMEIVLMDKGVLDNGCFVRRKLSMANHFKAKLAISILINGQLTSSDGSFALKFVHSVGGSAKP